MAIFHIPENRKLSTCRFRNLSKQNQMDQKPEEKKIEIGPETLRQLNVTRKWTMFLAVAGFIFLGLIIVLGLLTGTFLSAFSHTGQTAGMSDRLILGIFVLFGLINFFPVYFLFSFSKHCSDAVETHDSTDLLKALRSLKRFFFFIGILLISVILFYLTALVLSGRSFEVFRGL